MDPAQNSWSEYSRLVLKELETLAIGINSLRHEVADLKQEIAELRLKEDKVKELRDWKDKIDDVASPSQLREKIKQIDELNQFKTKAITIFAVVQFAVVSAIAMMKYM
jgi:Tfp pilus assembly protein PilO